MLEEEVEPRIWTTGPFDHHRSGSSLLLLLLLLFLFLPS